MIRTLTLAALAAALAAPMAHAQGTAARAGVNDSLFAAAAASGGLAEVSLSQLGVQKATDPELKRFSQQMIDEHTRMNSELTTLATQKRVALPRMADSRAQFCAQSLAGLSGEEFDRCYAKAQLVAHMDSVATFEAEAERGQDRDMKALAARTLPHLKDHLKMIKPIAERYEKEKPSTAGAASEKQEK
jgi:putative membrane protein